MWMLTGDDQSHAQGGLRGVGELSGTRQLTRVNAREALKTQESLVHPIRCPHALALLEFAGKTANAAFAQGCNLPAHEPS
jgi:hypothetical protein